MHLSILTLISSRLASLFIFQLFSYVHLILFIVNIAFFVYLALYRQVIKFETKRERMYVSHGTSFHFEVFGCLLASGSHNASICAIFNFVVKIFYDLQNVCAGDILVSNVLLSAAELVTMVGVDRRDVCVFH